jgi:membrane protein YqaA with SNARE-associated domain
MLYYFWIFIGTFLCDVVPLPLPPAFTVMVFFQMKFDLDIWIVIPVGVLGSVIGRYILFLYIPMISDKYFNEAKKSEVKYLGKKLSDRGIKGGIFVLLYSLLPLPTTPLFIAGGIIKLKPVNIFLPFLIGKFISDSISVLIGKYAAVNTEAFFNGMISWKSISGIIAFLILIFMFVFIDWIALIQHKKFKLKFKVLK